LLYLARHNGIAARPQGDQLRCRDSRWNVFPAAQRSGSVCNAADATRIIWLYGIDAAVQQPRRALWRHAPGDADAFAAERPNNRKTRGKRTRRKRSCWQERGPDSHPQLALKEPRPLSPRPAIVRYTGSVAGRKGPEANNTRCCKPDTAPCALPLLFSLNPAWRWPKPGNVAVAQGGRICWMC
jgi:hypothetical protein